MLKFVLSLFVLLGANLLVAQVPEHQYFPAKLLKDEGVKVITVFETKVDDPVLQAGRGNRIRLARNIVRASEYDRMGHAYRTLTYQNEGKNIVSEVLRTYNELDVLALEIKRHFNTNFADSTKLLQTHQRTLNYLPATATLQSSINSLVGQAMEIPVDSVAFVYDDQGRLVGETVYSLKGKHVPPIEKEYVYEGRKITVLSKFGTSVLNRDVFELDEKGRLIKESNYAPGDSDPRLVTTYNYDPRGWLEELRYDPNWQHFTKDVTVVSRKNKYDDHGKLVEAQLDYGNGQRLFEFYDYSYWVEN
jgi:hypothetical protein